MKIYFSTVVRSAPPRRGGELVLLDWDGRSVQRAVPIYAANPELDDPNPRGNTRGGRGIAFSNGSVIVASYHTLQAYDADLNHLRDISHSLMVGIHEVHSEGDGQVWVACTAIDAALKYDLRTGQLVQQYWPREHPKLQDVLGVHPLRFDKRLDNRGRFLSREHLEDRSHVHLNAIASWQGEIYALFNSLGIIANLDRGEAVIVDERLKGGHNLLIDRNGRVTVNDTWGPGIRIYDLPTASLIDAMDLMDFAAVRALGGWHNPMRRAKSAVKTIVSGRRSKPQALFVRGMDRVGDLLFVGVSPASIICIDEPRREVVDIFQYSRDVQVCVHGLKVLPS